MANSKRHRALLRLGVFVCMVVGCLANVGTPTEIFNKTDLEISESSPKIVGVKKHKNYEIVVYEYEESGEDKGKNEENNNASPQFDEVNDNSVEIPVLDHPTTAPTPISSNRFSKPKVPTTTTTTTTSSPPEVEEDPLEESASDEISSSVESEEESKEVQVPQPSVKPTTSNNGGKTSSHSNGKKSSPPTSKPRLPKPFRATESSRKSKKQSSSDEYEEDDDDEYSDEYDEDESGSFDDYYYGKKRGGKDTPQSRIVTEGKSNRKKPLPKRFGGTDEDTYEDFDESRGRRRPGLSGRGSSDASRPLRRPSGNKRITPKPFFPLKDSDEDEYEYDDDEEEDNEVISTTTKKPAKKSGSVNAIRLDSRKRHNATEEEDSYSDEAWGFDKSLTCEDPNGKKGICQEYARCSIYYQELLDDYDEPIDPAEYKCRLPTQVGICCPLVVQEDVLFDEPEKKSRIKTIGKRKQKRRVINPQIRRLIKTNLNNSLDFGDFFLEDLNVIENDLQSRSVQVTRNTPEFGHSRFFPTSKKIRQISNIGLSLLQTSNDISERLQLTNEIGGQGLKNFKSSNIEELNDRCPFQRPCRTSKYRSADGSCNNLQKPKMGQSLTPLARILEPVYADGRWVPRTSVRGFELPSARLLSQSFIGDRNFPDTRYTLMVMQFGQFLDHDLTSVPVFTFANNSGINCCRNGQFLAPNLRHPNCFPIEIPTSDPFYSRFGQRCMNFVRSRMAPRIDCSLGYADQMNALTHWIDASNIYGSTEEQTRQLRLFQGGLLRFSELGDGKMLLPLRNVGQGIIDYRAGDDRVNEMQGLMIMHLVWFREHNRLAFELARLNPFWNDEELFQEARRILTAEYQHLIYNEWLPIIIGRKYMEKAGIVPLTKGYYKGYDPKIDASIANAFSVAAFRMGHTLVQGLVKLIDELGRDNDVSVISQNDNNARRTRQPNQVDKWLRGMAQQPIQSFDPFVTEHLNGRLFQGSNGAFGMDLSSLNIQRSRDHGVPGYNAYRELCQVGRRARTFDDFKDWIAPETADKMSIFYAHPDDVDLWIGGINERPLPGALVGPTFACIIGDQFTRSKKGDRYFYDIADQTHSFSPEQLREIRKVTFSRILCDNGDDLEALQPAAFLQADFDFNSLVDCKRSTRIPRMNLRLWQKEPTPVV